MNHGPLIFLGAFIALAASWFGLVFQPYFQLGNAQPTEPTTIGSELYPAPRSGDARRGAEIYQSLGCATCHSQQVRQTGTVFDVFLSKPGTNLAELVLAMVAVKPGLTPPEANRLAEQTPVTLLTGVDQTTAYAAAEQLAINEAKADILIQPQGPDIRRGWGRARTVATDYLYDDPVLLGSMRIGPDLSNIGLRRPDPAWHLRHLYAPKLEEPKSVMPPYRFLFELREQATPQQAPPKPSGSREAVVQPLATPVTDASKAFYAPLQDLKEYGPEEGGMEVVPTEAARHLVAYLLSLRSDTPLVERPLSGLPTATPSATTTITTNAPANPE